MTDAQVQALVEDTLQSRWAAMAPDLQAQLEQYVTQRLEDFRNRALTGIAVGSPQLLRLIFADVGRFTVTVPTLGDALVPLDEVFQGAAPGATGPGGLFTCYLADVVARDNSSVVYQGYMAASLTGTPELAVHASIRITRETPSVVKHELLLRNFGGADIDVDVLVYRFAGLGGPIG